MSATSLPSIFGMTTSVTSRWISPVVAAGDVEGLGPAGGGEHVVAVAGEDPLGHLAQGVFVLDDQDGLALGSPLVGRGLGGGRGGLVGDREHDA